MRIPLSIHFALQSLGDFYEQRIKNAKRNLARAKPHANSARPTLTRDPALPSHRNVRSSFKRSDCICFGDGA
jgi:hypothetical protein